MFLLSPGSHLKLTLKGQGRSLRPHSPTLQVKMHRFLTAKQTVSVGELNLTKREMLKQITLVRDGGVGGLASEKKEVLCGAN